MSVLRKNILANYGGQAWMALMGVVFIPWYIRILGMEAFGLVGLMLSIQALSMLFDMGMGGALNRELARRVHDSDSVDSIGSLIRTFEWMLWPMALLIALAIWLVSGPLANHWLHPVELSVSLTSHAIAIMGVAVALQWPSSFYANGLSGLEQQPVLSVINAFFTTLRGAGVLIILYWVSPSIIAFMSWYALVGLCQSIASALILWRLLPIDRKIACHFRASELRATGRFAGGLVTIMALSVALAQLDRIVISAMMPLAELGYFSLAMSVAAGMGRMVQPLFNALYPRYSKLVSLRKYAQLSDLYHLSNQYLAVVVGAIGAVLVFFSRNVLFLWTGDWNTSEKVALPLSILAGGTAFNGLMNLPYALQLANGWTRLTISSNAIALALGVPFCIWAVENHGLVGASWLWLGINFCFVFVSVPLMHRHLLKGELRRWYVIDVLPPFAAAVAASATCRWLTPEIPRTPSGCAQIAVISGITLFASALASQRIRASIKRFFKDRTLV